MNHILDVLQKTDNWKELMRSSCKKNNINTSLAGDVTVLKLKMYNQRFQKSYAVLGDKIKDVWIENELRAYNWILIALSAFHDVKISDFGEQHWTILKDIFSVKSLVFLKFEAKRFIQAKIKKNINWSMEEQQILKRLVSEYENGKINWNTIAHSIFEKSEEKIFRTGKHCREHWLNYLDPQKQRGAWSPQQDRLLFERVKENGKKWSEYAALLKRTEHTVKNRYNSIISKQKKLSVNFKKQQKLVEEIIERLNFNIHNNSEGFERVPLVQQKRPIVEQIQQKQAERPHQDHIIQQMQSELSNEQMQQKGPNDRQKNVQNYSPNLFPGFDFSHYIKEDGQYKNNYGQYSVFSPFICSPNTPTNYLSSSPLFMIKQTNNIHNYITMFVNQLHQNDKQEDKETQK